MDATGRHRLIIEQVESTGRVAVTELAQRLEVTPETIRRDLTVLDRSGALRKVHGGAVPTSALALPETGVGHRERLNTAAKNAIARAALDHLGLAAGAPGKVGAAGAAGTTLLIDAGTTTGALARILPGGLDLTVLTSSVLTAAHLASRGDLTVRILGGQVRGITQAAVGPEALRTLSTLRVDVALMGTNGISATHGLSTPDPDEAMVKAAMVACARYVVVLADATKIGQEHLVSFAPLDDVNLIVTDAELPPALSTQLTTTGTEVLLA